MYVPSYEPSRDFYRILQVDPAAEPEVIDAAHLKLAKKYHPDTTESSDDTLRRMQDINEAFSVLGDAKKRAQYDKVRSAWFSPFEEEEVRREREKAESDRYYAEERQRRAQAEAHQRYEQERQRRAKAEVERIRAEAEIRRRAQAEAEEKRKRNRKAAIASGILITLMAFFLSVYSLVSMFRPCRWLDNLLNNPTGCVSVLAVCRREYLVH